MMGLYRYSKGDVPAWYQERMGWFTPTGDIFRRLLALADRNALGGDTANV